MDIKYISSSKSILNELEEAMHNFRECYYITPENTLVFVEKGIIDNLLIMTPEKHSKINAVLVREGVNERDKSILIHASPDDVMVLIDNWKYRIDYSSDN